MRHLLLLIILLPFYGFAQDLSGKWTCITTDSLQIILTIQQNNNKITGEYSAIALDDSSDYYTAACSGAVAKNGQLVIEGISFISRSADDRHDYDLFRFTLKPKKGIEDSLVGNMIQLNKSLGSSLPVRIGFHKPLTKKIQTTTKENITDSNSVLMKRANELIEKITVSSAVIKIAVMDNAEYDGDTVSIYVNDKPLLKKSELTNKALSFQLKKEDYSGHVKITLVAENLGSIPPNTALLRVIDGEKIHEIKAASDLSKNAVIEISFIKTN